MPDEFMYVTERKRKGEIIQFDVDFTSRISLTRLRVDEKIVHSHGNLGGKPL